MKKAIKHFHHRNPPTQVQWSASQKMTTTATPLGPGDFKEKEDM
jgi:hypothetical protein